jgi:hypothetical protein
MKRCEAKFVHASPRMSPDQIKAAPRVREDRPQTKGKGLREKTARAVAAGRASSEPETVLT